eukprot:2045391-Lingulodinium_polyedra.AAC.1
MNPKSHRSTANGRATLPLELRACNGALAATPFSRRSATPLRSSPRWRRADRRGADAQSATAPPNT